jgi:uncharacterized protein
VDRLETVRQVVVEILHQQPDPEQRRCGFSHLYGVSDTCTLLAVKRGLDPLLCAVAGMLHDIWTHKTGDPTDHALFSAREAEKILAGLDCFSPEEIASICGAIARHSAKAERDGEMTELLKDADVLQHYLYNPALGPQAHDGKRLARILYELGMELDALDAQEPVRA